jgi:prepilin-type N-terminal cleavage/methylation domain-containing protein
MDQHGLRHHRACAERRDSGFTLVEVTITIVIMGVLTAAMAMAISIVLRTSPDTTDRIDDARATRGLSTWLAQDTMSTPPYLPETSQGGMNIDTSPAAENNDCGGAGQNIVHFQWRERTTSTTTFVANYRFVVDDGSGFVTRYTCFQEGTSAFQPRSALRLTPALDPTAPPQASVVFDTTGDVEFISFTLTGKTGETVLIDTSSRNPADFFS